MNKVKFNIDNKRSNNTKERDTFFVTIQPELKVLQNMINRHLYLLYMNDEVKRVFTPKPMVSFRSFRKISSHLVRAKLFPIERTVGSFRCGSKRCEVCKYITETDTFTSSVTGETQGILEGHTEFLDVSITLIDKTDGSNPTKRENYWMQTLKAFAPDGLNVVDSV